MRHLVARSVLSWRCCSALPVGSATASSLSVRFTAFRTPAVRGGTAAATVHTAPDDSAASGSSMTGSGARPPV